VKTSHISKPGATRSAQNRRDSVLETSKKKSAPGIAISSHDDFKHLAFPGWIGLVHVKGDR
jgi:hypothetical protein